MKIKNSQDIAQILQTVKPIADDTFKSSLKTSLLLQTREAADSQNLWEKLKIKFNFYNYNMNLSSNFKFGLITIAILSFTALGVHAYPQFNKIFECEAENGNKCFKIIYGLDLAKGSIWSNHEISNTIYAPDLTEDKALEQLKTVQLIGDIQNYPSIKNQLSNLPILREDDNLKVYIDKSFVPEVYVIKNNSLYHAGMVMSKPQQSDINRRIEEILNAIQSNKITNPHEINNLGNIAKYSVSKDERNYGVKDFREDYKKMEIDGYMIYFAGDVTNGPLAKINEKYYPNYPLGFGSQSALNTEIKEGYEQIYIVTPNGLYMSTQIDYINHNRESELPKEFSKLIEQIKTHNYKDTDMSRI